VPTASRLNTPSVTQQCRWVWALSAEPNRCTKLTAPKREPGGALQEVAQSPGEVITHWRTGTCGNTCSTRWAAVSGRRRSGHGRSRKPGCRTRDSRAVRARRNAGSAHRRHRVRAGVPARSRGAAAGCGVEAREDGRHPCLAMWNGSTDDSRRRTRLCGANRARSPGNGTINRSEKERPRHCQGLRRREEGSDPEAGQTPDKAAEPPDGGPAGSQLQQRHQQQRHDVDDLDQRVLA